MGFFNFFNRGSSSITKDISVKKQYLGNDLSLTFNTSWGNSVVNVTSSISPTGERGVMYDCFLIAANRWMQQGMEENEFIDDMKRVFSLFENGLETDNIMKSLLKHHISEKGRLIDTDLCTYITELYLAQKSLNRHCNRDILLDKMLQLAEDHFGNNLYITMYRRVGMGLQPYLITYKEFENGRR